MIVDRAIIAEYLAVVFRQRHLGNSERWIRSVWWSSVMEGRGRWNPGKVQDIFYYSTCEYRMKPTLFVSKIRVACTILQVMSLFSSVCQNSQGTSDEGLSKAVEILIVDSSEAERHYRSHLNKRLLLIISETILPWHFQWSALPPSKGLWKDHWFRDREEARVWTYFNCSGLTSAFMTVLKEWM